MTSFDAFLDSAWADHADRADEVAERLALSRGLVTSPAQLQPFVMLATHVYGEHLGRWADGVRLLESLRELPAFDGTPAVNAALSRNIATLRYTGGDAGALDALAAAQRAVSDMDAHAYSRKRALVLYAQLPEEDRAACVGDLRELGN